MNNELPFLGNKDEFFESFCQFLTERQQLPTLKPHFYNDGPHYDVAATQQSTNYDYANEMSDEDMAKMSDGSVACIQDSNRTRTRMPTPELERRIAQRFPNLDPDKLLAQREMRIREFAQLLQPRVLAATQMTRES